MNAPQSRRFAKFADARQSRSVWTARVFSTALGRDEEFNATGRADLSRRNPVQADEDGRRREKDAEQAAVLVLVHGW